jgi:hypothetical protein
MKRILLTLLSSILIITLAKSSDVIMSTSGTYTVCSANFYDAGGPTADYPNNQNVVIILVPETPGAKVSVTFNSFSTAVLYYDGALKTSDILYVYNGNSTAAPQIGAMQGVAYGTVTSTAADGSLTFKFVSHSYGNTTGIKAGWSATISCSPTPPNDITMIGGTFTTCGGKFYDSGGPFGDYMNDQNTTLTIYPATSGAKVSVTFDSFSTAVLYYDGALKTSDILYVYNGNSIEATQIGALQGQSGYGTITSTAADGSLTFRFVSRAYTNTTGIKKGWSATISCSSTPPDIITMIAGTAFTTCTGKFYDSGGPDGDYMNDQNSTLTLYPATPGAKVSVTFDSFSTAVLYYDGALLTSDILYVYNGNSTEATQIGALQGQSGYGTITSTAADGSLTFRFVSRAYTNTTGIKKGWSATVTCNSGSTLNVYPRLSLSPAQIKTGQTIRFTGKQFSPFGKVDLSFSGPGMINPVQNYGIDVLGFFEYVLTIASSQKSGTYIVTATDKITGKSFSRNFQIVESNITDDNLRFTEPKIACSRLVGDPIVIAWGDQVKFNVVPIYNYLHSYIIEYQLDNGDWQIVNNIGGNNPGYGTINLSTTYSPTITGVYKFRVTDNYYPGRSTTTPEITVTSSTNLDVKIDFLWDKRFLPTSNVNSPIGVAADGVARFYMVASIVNPSSSSIQKVKVSLSDPESYESTQYLGKVMYCTSQNDKYFTEEANQANSITAENTSNNIDGKYWFWYVAPDDFARNEGDWKDGERIITATFNIALADGNSIITKRDIKIARPPLMLAHGLNGDISTWNDFQVGSNHPIYDKDPRFSIHEAVRFERNSHFSVNSNLLLSERDNGISFISLINKMKNAGYACCQVDYVCHSMGGSILRNAVENTYSYKRKNTYFNGYVNKFISLNTPHQGSSFANVLNDIGNAWILAAPIFIPGALSELYEVKPLSVKVVDAVEDLKFENGVKFNITEVPSHLIGSGVSCYSFNPQTALIYEYVKTYISAFLPGTGLLDHCSWYQIYFDLFGYEPDFMDVSDAVVSLRSQFSGYSANALPDFCTRIYGPMHNSTFGESPTESPAVWDRVNELLNKNVNSSLFYSMPATGVSAKKLTLDSQKQNFTIIEDRISILHPISNEIYNAGDTINIKVHADTTGLRSFALFFQDQMFFDIPSTPDTYYNLIVSPEYIENQSISIIGNYFISNAASISSANINIKVNPVGSILDFYVQPEVMIIEKNKSRRPDYEALFLDAISQIGESDLITTLIKDPDLITYNSTTNEFTGIAIGSTMATVSYRGKSKVVFFEIIQYEEAPVDLVTGIDEIENDNIIQISVTVYPNPTKGVFTIATKEKDYELNIINIFGERILAQKFHSEISVIDLSSQPGGIYFLHFNSINGSLTKKIIILK